jgi:hypothetical protein
MTSYLSHFQHADDIITHLNSIVPTMTDPLLQAKYAGFVAVAAVTVFEIAIKDIFISFARGKHKVLGSFTESHFNRINGKISFDAIRNDYIKRFGSKYQVKFDKKFKTISDLYLATHRNDLKILYSNLITWRNDFAHEGRIRTNSTYQDTVLAYQGGKEMIRCIAETMVR